jgi:hypothetical protein
VPPPSLFITHITIMRKNIQQPTVEEQKRLDDVLENSTDYVTIRNRKFGIKWLHRGTLRKLTHVLHSCEKEDEVTAKCASLIILNGWWKIKLFHWIYWRMLWKKYTDSELIDIIAVGKKKVESQKLEYLSATMFLTGMKDTMMTMTRKEAEHILQGLRQEQDSQTERNTPS